MKHAYAKITTALALLLLSSPIQGQEVEIDSEASVLAVITHKAGLAAKLAHNHLVVARSYEASLQFDPAEPATARFRLEAPVAQLVIDDAAEQARRYPRIAELGILDEPFAEISAKDRDKIRKAMVGKKQLNLEAHPKLSAEIVSISARSDEAFPWAVELKIEIVGQAVTRTVAGRYELDGDRVRIEAHGELRFTDFGIEPYSAMLGAVRNDDPFHLYVLIEGKIPTPRATSRIDLGVNLDTKTSTIHSSGPSKGRPLRRSATHSREGRLPFLRPLTRELR